MLSESATVSRSERQSHFIRLENLLLIRENIILPNSIYIEAELCYFSIKKFAEQLRHNLSLRILGNEDIFRKSPKINWRHNLVPNLSHKSTYKFSDPI